ncbi:MAG: hypothetical protein ACP5QT_05025 [Brevinematia bacterium]
MVEVTNFTLIYDTNKVGFLKEGIVTYHFDNLKILDVSLLNNDFVRNSVILKIDSFDTNTINFRIRSFEKSEFKIPPFQIKAIDGNATNVFIIPQTIIKTTPVSINVTNKQPIEEIYSFFDPSWIILPIILALVAASVFLSIKFFKNRKKKIEERTEVNPIDEFIARIAKIKAMELTKQNYKEIFVKISEGVRTLLEKLLKFNALEMASSEILNFLKNATNEEIVEITGYILKHCDRVKFAKHIPTLEEKENCILECENLVQLLTKKEEEKLTSEVKNEV